MMGGQPAAEGTGGTPEKPPPSPDTGILLACCEGDYDTIVNALFAHLPHTPAIDIYEKGRLVAGYSYASLDDCRSELSAVLARHLSGCPSMG